MKRGAANRSCYTDDDDTLHYLMNLNERRYENDETNFSFIIVITFLSFVVTLAAMILGLVIYLDVRKHGDACDCIEQDTNLLLQRLTEIIENTCSGANQ